VTDQLRGFLNKVSPQARESFAGLGCDLGGIQHFDDPLQSAKRVLQWQFFYSLQLKALLDVEPDCQAAAGIAVAALKIKLKQCDPPTASLQ